MTIALSIIPAREMGQLFGGLQSVASAHHDSILVLQLGDFIIFPLNHLFDLFHSFQKLRVMTHVIETMQKHRSTKEMFHVSIRLQPCKANT